MKVKRLKINSFRGIGDLTLEFLPDLPTVLVGINSTGKSSILDCLAILFSHFVAEIQDPIGIGRFSNEQEISQEQKVTRRFFRLEDITQGKKKTENEITIDLDNQEISWFLSLAQVEGRIKPVISSDVRKLQGACLKIKNNLRGNPEVNLPLPVYYHVNREFCDDIPRETLEQHWSERLDVYNQALTGVRISFRSFFDWFKELEDLENELRRDNPDYRDRQLEAVRHAISSMLDGFSDLRVRRVPLCLSVRKNDQELIIDQLSEGEKGLLALAGDLARRLALANPYLAYPLQGSGVILIDEIELHLHPQWQRRIIPKLTKTFPNCQFIVTTHSPQVIRDLHPESIYLLEETGEGVIVRKPTSSLEQDMNSIVAELMGISANSLAIKDHLVELFRLIEKGELEAARKLQLQIAEEIGVDIPKLAKA